MAVYRVQRSQRVYKKPTLEGRTAEVMTHNFAEKKGKVEAHLDTLALWLVSAHTVYPIAEISQTD